MKIPLLDELSDEDRRALWGHMRVPVFAFVALMALLAAIVLLGALAPGTVTSWIVVGLTLCMAVTVLLFSMEVRDDAPITRFYAAIGFFWVAILFGMTMLDYLSR